jgi:hypothetical protein
VPQLAVILHNKSVISAGGMVGYAASGLMSLSNAAHFPKLAA